MTHGEVFKGARTHNFESIKNGFHQPSKEILHAWVFTPQLKIVK